MKISVEFDLIGGFPELLEKLKPDMPLNSFLKVLAESWLIDRVLDDEYAEYIKDLDFFIMKINGQHTIFGNEYKDEIKEFLDDRKTSKEYCRRIQNKIKKENK